jgi:glycosyltransferase involved in cell wall biosynthesis
MSESAAGRRLRVLQVGKFYPPHWGGMETHLKTLCESLVNEVDVQAVVSNNAWLTESGHEGQVPVTRLANAFTIASTPICPSLASTIRNTHADVVHIHWPNPWAALSYLAAGSPGRLVITYHSDVVRQKNLAMLLGPLFHRLFAKAAAVLVTSQSYLDSSTFLQSFRDKCHVVPLGIDVARFSELDRAKVEQLRAEHGPRIVLAVGRHVYYKGFDVLIRAMAEVHGRLVLIGNGSLTAKLRRLCSEQWVALKVDFIDAVSDADLVAWYHAADVFVLPAVARSEAFGLAQVEAMACGLPVVNTQIESGVPWVSKNGLTGVTVAPHDPAPLAQALNRLLREPGTRKAMGRAGLDRARQVFSREAMTAATTAVYRHVVEDQETSLARMRPAIP